MRSTLRHADWFARPGDKVLLAGRKVENHHKRMCELLLSRTALLPTSAHPDTVQWSSKFREETTKRKAPSTSGTKGERVDEDSFFVWRSVLLLYLIPSHQQRRRSIESCMAFLTIPTYPLPHHALRRLFHCPQLLRRTQMLALAHSVAERSMRSVKLRCVVSRTLRYAGNLGSSAQRSHMIML